MTTIAQRLADAGMEVKPLEWVERTDIDGLHNAKGLHGLWVSIWDQNNGLFVYDGDPALFDAAQPRSYAGLEAAKSAAQADYTARILSALQVKL